MTTKASARAQETQIRNMNRILGQPLDSFNVDAYIAEGAAEKIVSELTQGVKTKRQYLNAVVVRLPEEYKDIYKAIQRGLYAEAKAVPTVDYSVHIATLKTLTEKGQLPGLRVLATLLLNNMLFSMKAIIGTATQKAIDTDYVDVVREQWCTYSVARVVKKTPLEPQVAEVVRDVAGEKWLLELDGRQKYQTIQYLSKLFSVVIPCGYREMRNYMIRQNKTEPERIVLPRKTGPIVILRSARMVDPMKLIEKLQQERVLSGKLPLSQITVDKYAFNVIALQECVFGKHSKLVIERFLMRDASAKVEQFLATMKLRTASALITALSRLLEVCPTVTPMEHVIYFDIAMSYKRQCSELTVRELPIFDEILSEIIRIKDHSKIPMSVKILFLMIIHSVNHGEEDIGVLRISDLIHTKMGEDEEYSYMDLERRIWHIRSGYTKNKQERELTIPQEFVDDLKKVWGATVPEWLLTKADGTKYEETAVLSKQFRYRVRCNPKDIRASYAKHLHNGGNMEKCKEMAKKMGHHYSTVLTDYIDRIKQDGETVEDKSTDDLEDTDDSIDESEDSDMEE